MDDDGDIAINEKKSEIRESQLNKSPDDTSVDSLESSNKDRSVRKQLTPGDLPSSSKKKVPKNGKSSKNKSKDVVNITKKLAPKGSALLRSDLMNGKTSAKKQKAPLKRSKKATASKSKKTPSNPREAVLSEEEDVPSSSDESLPEEVSCETNDREINAELDDTVMKDFVNIELDTCSPVELILYELQRLICSSTCKKKQAFLKKQHSVWKYLQFNPIRQTTKEKSLKIIAEITARQENEDEACHESEGQGFDTKEGNFDKIYTTELLEKVNETIEFMVSQVEKNHEISRLETVVDALGDIVNRIENDCCDTRLSTPEKHRIVTDEHESLVNYVLEKEIVVMESIEFVIGRIECRAQWVPYMEMKSVSTVRKETDDDVRREKFEQEEDSIGVDTTSCMEPLGIERMQKRNDESIEVAEEMVYDNEDYNNQLNLILKLHYQKTPFSKEADVERIVEHPNEARYDFEGKPVPLHKNVLGEIYGGRCEALRYRNADPIALYRRYKKKFREDLVQKERHRIERLNAKRREREAKRAENPDYDSEDEEDFDEMEYYSRREKTTKTLSLQQKIKRFNQKGNSDDNGSENEAGSGVVDDALENRLDDLLGVEKAQGGEDDAEYRDWDDDVSLPDKQETDSNSAEDEWDEGSNSDSGRDSNSD